MTCMWWAKWCCVIGMSSILIPWFVWFVRQPSLPYTLFLGILCDMCWNQCALFVCVDEGLSVVIVCVLLSIAVLYWLLFLFVVFLSSLNLDAVVDYCYDSILHSEFLVRSFSNVGRKLSHSNCIGSIWICI